MARKVVKYITLKHTGWKVTGTAVINLWNGGKGKVLMDSETLRQGTFPTRREIAKCINDGKFDCESIESADVRLWQVFGENEEHCILIEDFQFSSKQLLLCQ